MIDWAGMSFRASKSRSLVIEKGKCVKESVFFVNGPDKSSRELIPSIHASPIKFLGRVISASLSDSNEVRSFSEAVCKSFRAIDKCHLREVQKVWSYITCFFLALDDLNWFTKCLFRQSENLSKRFLLWSESGYDFIIPSQAWPFILRFLLVLCLWRAWLWWWKRQRLAATFFFETLLTHLSQTTAQTWKLGNGQLRTQSRKSSQS